MIFYYYSIKIWRDEEDGEVSRTLIARNGITYGSKLTDAVQRVVNYYEDELIEGIALTSLGEDAIEFDKNVSFEETQKMFGI